MALRNRVRALERRLRPGGLVRAWQESLTVMNTRWAWGWTPAEVEAEARARAATGEDPGTVLAQALVEQADRWKSAVMTDRPETPLRCPGRGRVLGVVRGEVLVIQHRRRSLGVALAGVRWLTCQCGTLLKLR